MAAPARPEPLFPRTAEGFAAFYNFMMGGRFTFPVHLGPLARALLDDRIRNLMALVGPGSGKSMAISVAYPAFELGHDPTLTILGISAGEALMQGFQRAIMDWVEKDPRYQVAFPGVVPDKDLGWSTDRGMFVRGHAPGDPDPSYLATGLTSKQLTGKHGRIIIVDDLHDEETGRTAEQCLRVRQSWYRTVMGRADPRGAKFVVAGRRWNEEDVYGTSETQPLPLGRLGSYVIMELPAIREGTEDCYWDVHLPAELSCCFTDDEEAPL